MNIRNPSTFLAVLPLLAGTVIFGFVFSSYNSYKEKLYDRMESTSQLHGRLVAEQVRGRLSSLDLLLLMLESRSGGYDLSEEENSQPFYRYLQSRALLLTPVSRIYVLDGEGRLDYSTDFHDKGNSESLYAALVHSHVDQFLSFAVMSWMRGGELQIVLSRRLDNPDGSLSRILAAEIPESMLFDEIDYSDSMILKQAVLFNEEGQIYATFSDDGCDMGEESLSSCLGLSRGELAELKEDGLIGGIRTIIKGDHISTLIQMKDFSFQLGLYYDMTPQLEVWRTNRMATLIFVAAGSLVVFLFSLVVLRMAREKQRVQDEMMEKLEKMVDERTGELNRALKEIERLVSYDPLTGALNRRGMLERLEQNFARVRRYGGSFTLVMCDIDYFKRINDTYGHGEGDKALCYTVSLIQERLRKSDFLSRWGGEEFLIYYSEIDHDQAMALTEKLRISFEEQPMDPSHPMTCSFGVATLGECESTAELIKRADDAMYRAKRMRNCVSD